MRCGVFRTSHGYNIQDCCLWNIPTDTKGFCFWQQLDISILTGIIKRMIENPTTKVWTEISENQLWRMIWITVGASGNIHHLQGFAEMSPKSACCREHNFKLALYVSYSIKSSWTMCSRKIWKRRQKGSYYCYCLRRPVTWYGGEPPRPLTKIA